MVTNYSAFMPKIPFNSCQYATTFAVRCKTKTKAVCSFHLILLLQNCLQEVSVDGVKRKFAAAHFCHYSSRILAAPLFNDNNP